MRNHLRGIPRKIYNFRRNRPRNLREQICNRREQVVRAGCKLLRTNCQSKYQHCGGSLQSCAEKNIRFDCKYSKPNAVRARRNAFMRDFPDFVCMPAFSCSSIYFTHFAIYRIIFGVGNFSTGFFVCSERKCSIFVSVLFCFYLLRL